MKKKYNLTSSQLRVLFEFDESGKLIFTDKNIIWGHLKINQKIDFDGLKEALNYCFQKNDGIRLKLCKEDDKLLQYFEDYQEQNFEIVDVDTENDVKNLENDIINKPFEMFNSFLFQVAIYRYKNGFGGIILKFNHVIADGYTLGLLLYEVLGYYSKTVKKIISFSYVDYIKSEEKYPSSRRCKQDRKYWYKIFENGVPDAAYIPSNKENYSFSKANKLTFDIDDDTINIVKDFCKTNKISNSSFYMSIYAIYIHKKTNFTNFFLSAANRNRTRIKEMLTAGMLTKTAYFTVQIQNDKFVDFTKKMRLSLKSCYKHMNYIYNYKDELFSRYNDNRALPSNVFISYQNLQVDTHKMNINFDIAGDNNVGTYGTDVVSIHIFEYKGKVKIIYDYLSDKYSVEEITNINNSIIDIIKQISADNSILIQDIKV